MASAGVDTAFYLVHSMSDSAEFEAQERKAAANFGAAAREAGVKRIVYLGGLAHGARLSRHVRSRIETGEVLRSSGVPVVELRASIVVHAHAVSQPVALQPLADADHPGVRGDRAEPD